MTEEKVQALKTLTLFARGLYILGGLFGAFGIYFLFTANESLSWASVKGSVVQTQVLTEVLQGPDPTRTSSPIEYYVSVEYTYDVEGSPYVSSRYSLGGGSRATDLYSERAEAEAEAAERFPVGSALTVRYDPKEPTSAVLAPGWNWGTFVPLLFGLFLGGSGWLFDVAVKTAETTPGK